MSSSGAVTRVSPLCDVMLAWFILIGGHALVFAIDCLLRMRDGNVRDGGLAEPLMSAMQWGLIIAFAIYGWKSTRIFSAVWQRIAGLLLHLVVGFGGLAFLSYVYFIGNGIDSI